MEEGVEESRMCVPWLPVYTSGCEFLGKLEPPACVAPGRASGWLFLCLGEYMQQSPFLLVSHTHIPCV